MPPCLIVVCVFRPGVSNSLGGKATFAISGSLFKITLDKRGPGTYIERERRKKHGKMVFGRNRRAGKIRILRTV
jgi:hypothetical protein